MRRALAIGSFVVVLVAAATAVAGGNGVVASSRPPDRRSDRRGHHGPQPGRREGGPRACRLVAGTGGPATTPDRGLSARIVRRAEAARDDRDGAFLQPISDHRRRAHDRPRRHGAGSGLATAEGASTGPRPRDAVHHSRSLGPRGGLRHARGDVRGEGDRGRTGRACLPLAGPPVHESTRGGLPRDRRLPIPRAAGRPRRRSARPAGYPGGMPVPSSLS